MFNANKMYYVDNNLNLSIIQILSFNFAQKKISGKIYQNVMTSAKTMRYHILINLITRKTKIVENLSNLRTNQNLS